jgi:sugar lactone lactonase YvrE
LATVLTPEVVANLAFGGADGKTLFLMGRTSLYQIHLKVPGILP